MFVCSYTADEIHFNLLAIVSDRRMLYKKEIEELEARKDLAAQRVCHCQYSILSVCFQYNNCCQYI